LIGEKRSRQRQGSAPRLAVDQFHVRQPLEIGDMPGDGWLTDAELSRGRRE
jgi:hypothetical protein